MTGKSENKNHVRYVYVGGNPFSLSIADSDTTQTQTLLDPVVGTLVKYGPTGIPEPYLAKQWSVSSDYLEYRFVLEKGLTCEDGYLLTPSNFVKSLLRQLYHYGVKRGGLEFEKLEGWESFRRDEKVGLKGLRADDATDTVIFKFKKRPGDLLNFLRMPYFGFFSPSNFDGDGRQVDTGKVISCGAFSVVSSDLSSIELKKRSDWRLGLNSQVDAITFAREDQFPSSNPVVPTIVDSPLIAEHSVPPGFFKVQGAPDMLTAIVLSPKLPFFKDVKIRQWFASEIRRKAPEFFEGLETSTYSPGFFEDAMPSPFSAVSPAAAVGTKLRIFLSPRLETKVRERLIRFFEQTLRPLGAQLDYPKVDLSDRRVSDELYANTLADIRVSAVSVPPSFLPSVYRMMFCSELGISFPDPEGRMCKLIDRFEEDGSADERAYREKVELAIMEDATVVPIGRKRLVWLYSDQFDPSSSMPIPNYPRFELLKLK